MKMCLALIFLWTRPVRPVGAGVRRNVVTWETSRWPSLLGNGDRTLWACRLVLIRTIGSPYLTDVNVVDTVDAALLRISAKVGHVSFGRLVVLNSCGWPCCLVLLCRLASNRLKVLM